MNELSLDNKECYFSDYNIENYKVLLANIIIKYNEIVVQYLNRIREQTKINKLDYLKYIIISGVKTITHVFRMLLFSSKNQNLSYEYCNKAVYYYIEFISQIGYENNSYLKLTPKDAGLFVYKKTIFNIVAEFIKQPNNEQTSEINELILNLTDLVMYRIIKCISNETFIDISELELLICKLKKYTKSLINMIDHKNTNNNNIKEKLSIVSDAENILQLESVNSQFELFENIIKKLEKECNKTKIKEIITKSII
jgi:hypothetical protein